MRNRLPLLVPAVLAVVLWVVGLVVSQALSSNLSDSASDAQVLAWLHANTNDVIVGGWLFMCGCVAFLWFAATLRERLAVAEGGTHTYANLLFGGAVAVAALGIGTQGDTGVAINVNDVSPATAGALHHVGDLFFIGAELLLVIVMAATAVLAFRTAALPRWWGVLSALIGVVLVIGPIGWAALIFGLPVWTIGSSLVVGRTPRRRRAVVPATA